MTKKGGTKVPPFFLSYIGVRVPSEFRSLTANGITYWGRCSWTLFGDEPPRVVLHLVENFNIFYLDMSNMSFIFVSLNKWYYTMYTKEQIQYQLQHNPKWIERGLVVLYNRQTEDEKMNSETKYENGVGFNGSDVKYLTYCSKWVLGGRHLSGVHLQKCGKMLKKYWKQIQNEIERKTKVG